MSSQFKKLVYSECDIEGHCFEPMSRVCIDEDCSNKTIICCICEQLEHKKHKTLPLKTFLQKISSEPGSEAKFAPLHYTSLIDQYRSSYFRLLAHNKEEINNMMNDLEIQGKIYFSRIEQTAMSLIQMSNPADQLMTQGSNIKKMRTYFAKVLKIANPEEKGGFSIKKKLDVIIEACKEKEKKVIDNITPWIQDFEVRIKKVLLALDESLSLTFKEPAFAWSDTFKGAKVKINGALAEQSGMESSGQRFAMMEPSLSDFGNKKITWGVKVKKFVGWVGVGICLRNLIKKANYHFNYTNIGHGSYLISSNGYSWSHSVKEFNSANKTFQFTVNDVIYMEYDPIAKKLRFRKNDTTHKFELDITLPPPIDDAYHPCVNLCSTGDSVEFVLPGKPLS